MMVLVWVLYTPGIHMSLLTDSSDCPQTLEKLTKYVVEFSKILKENSTNTQHY